MVACSADQSASSCTDTSVMMWSVKIIDCPPREFMRFQVSFIIAALALFTYFTWLMWDAITESAGFFIGSVCASGAYFTYMIMLVIRQKTTFNYHIKTQSGSVEYFLHYPAFAGPLFKGIAIFTILFFLGVALVTGSLLFLVGPAAISLGAARTLLNWSNPIHHRETRPWDMHNFVTLDRKRSIIVIHCTDITTGFVAHLPNKELFEQYLQFLHSVLPPTAEYMEKDWEW
ncbi:permease [Pseudomonas lijiangensis]|uniref:Permease n=2 Tax=Pseudomonas lijiangensis TaxID=2995658 RepID=A0ABX8HYJ7_9PSED|nr:permease [Pseudomonas lijiangensis]MBX8508047.1 permease [Pseudomonas lijiangensis]QWU85744.1 permease [Pseudomonas lijiangensis]